MRGGCAAWIGLGWVAAVSGGEEPLELGVGAGWERFIGVRAQAGYKDNVLLSSQEAEGSPFVGAGLEAIAWRPVGLSGELEAFVVGEHRQFLSAQEVEWEQTLVAHVQHEQHLGLDWTVRLPADYVYVDQVLDVSATEELVQAARVRGHTVGLSPAVQRHWVPGTLELELAGFRQRYAEPLDPAWEVAAKLEWQHRFSSATQGIFGYGYGHTWYDTEPSRTESGEAVPGTRREMARQEVSLKLTHEWGEERCWQFMAKASGRLASDRGSRYFDYIRPAAGLQLGYRRGAWLVESEVSIRHYDYLTQEVSETNDAGRRRSELGVELRIERELLDWLRLIGEYSYEETFANRVYEEYSVNTVSGGLEVSF